MSTRKSVNKQNAESPVPGSQDKSSASLKSSPDAGSESEPSTPTSRDGNSTPALDSKRKRRINSTQSSAPTSKKTSDSADTASAADDDDKNVTKGDSVEKIEDAVPSLDSPKTRKRRVFDKSAIVTRKSTSDLAKNSVRTRGVARQSLIKTVSPKESEATKRRLRKKPETASTPAKRKREDSSQSEDNDEEMPAEKCIKVEQPDPDDENEHEQEESPIKIKAEKLEEAEENESNEAEKSLEVKSESGNEELKVGETTRKYRRKSAPTSAKKVSPKIAKKQNETVVTPTRRGRIPRNAVAAVATAPSKPGRKPKVAETKPTLKSPVPEQDKITETEVPESTEIVIKCEPAETEPAADTCAVTASVEKPLTVDTVANPDEKEKIAITSSGASTEKAASLSPAELVSEGVSEMSVMQFYKKPEFLENNLGIEQDPKLGGIVQEVEKDSNKNVVDEESQTALIYTDDAENHAVVLESENDCSDLNASDSIKEGELLIVEDSTEEETSLTLRVADDEERDTPPILEPEETTERSDITENQLEAPELEKAIIKDVEIIEDMKEIAVAKNEIMEKVCDLEIKMAVDESRKEDESKEVVKSEESKTEKEADEKLKVEEEAVESSPKAEVEQKEAEKPVEDAVGLENTENVIQNEEDVKPKEDECNDSVQMEIDSGVSDIAENNLSDPNEDLNLPPEEVSKEDPVELESHDGVVENKENIADMKENIDCIRIVNVSSLSEKDFPNEPDTIKKTSENSETLKEKENHLKSLGLLTLKAADEAKIEKQKRRELFQSTASTSSNRKINGNSCTEQAGNGNKSLQEYTGTLKTVIKLNRPMIGPNSTEKQLRKANYGGMSINACGSSSLAATTGPARHPLKMTIQKGRGRGAQIDRNVNQSQQSTEDTYYTIQNEGEATGSEVPAIASTTQHGRKSHNRSHNNTESVSAPEMIAPTEKKEEKAAIVIPEKASSFSIHPGRLCQDQCFYCGGKFGLYDTPCHVAQLKSLERQKKILDNEEKLTVDNCLCDACFRHVDRRANVPSYKKRLSVPASQDGGDFNSAMNNESMEATSGATSPIHPGNSLVRATCFVTNCEQPASHTFRRKGFRKTIRKLLGDDLDLSNLGGRLPICDKHYEVIVQCLECALCKRRLVKNHMYHITQDVQQLEELLMKQGIPVKLYANPAVCKLCRYFTNLLVKPPEGKTQKAQFVKNYRRRLLHFHNIQSDDASEADEQSDSKDTAVAPVPAKRGRKPKKPETELTATPQPISRKSSTCNESTPISSDENSNDDVTEIVAAASGQMMLANDVMVDYDVPVLCDSPSPPAVVPPSKLQTILQGGNLTQNNDDISIVLRSNPNISMRELFPGEEEMGLNVNIPFGGSTSMRTPEGWTRIQTFLQYDEPTRRLWEDLQKPYGNQSSFLRHLVLLEKYFRNGDLILSQDASTNAVVYSETVQTRLQSYDNCSISSKITAPNNNSTQHTSNKSNNNSSSNNNSQNSRPTVSQLLRQPEHMRKLNNLTITITPKPKPTAGSSSSSTANPSQNLTSTISSNITKPTGSGSILKSNLLGRKNSAVEIIPISGSPNESNTAAIATSNAGLTKQQKILAAANQLMCDDKTTTPSGNMAIAGPSYASTAQSKSSTYPPQLISINRGNIGRGGGGGSGAGCGGSMSNNSINASNKFQHSNLKQQLAANRPGTSKTMPVTVVKLPGSLTQQERISSKNWRPTLMPINSGPVRSAPNVLYETADGRKLPSLVQVQSGGRPFLISIHDYNRMCLLRREKILREQAAMKIGGSSSSGGNSGPNGNGKQMKVKPW